MSNHDENEASDHPDILVVAPWLQGGGGQGALAGVLRDIPKSRVRLIVLFNDNRDTESVTSLVGETVFLDMSRNPIGVARASRRLAAYVRQSSTIYSLMRASHLVLGMLPSSRLAEKRLAATFHQLPSQDSTGLLGRVEDVLVKRATRRAHVVTAPSQRAVDELVERGFASKTTARFESNRIAVTATELAPAHDVDLEEVHLLVAGRLSKQKGIDRLPELLSGATTSVILRVAGSGELADEVARWQESTDFPARVEYVGYVPELTDHLDWCDAVLMPSRWELNPLVVWESWARGKPVLASRLPVFEDLSEAGPLFTFETPAELSDHIERRVVPASARNHHMSQALAANALQAREGNPLAEFLTAQ